MRLKRTNTAGRRAKIVRRGTSIIELMGMMGLLMVIGATTYRSLGNITRANQDRQARRSSRLEVERFANAIRQDERISNEVFVSDRAFEFSDQERQVRYRWGDDTSIVFREVLVEETLQAVDRFSFRSGMQIKASLGETTGELKLLSVKIADDGPEASEDSVGSQGFLIEVAI